jgi:ACS family hexuronate transporter-like MFS transporter
MSTVTTTEPLPLEYAGRAGGPPPVASRFRWVVLALVFFGITINYVDRLVMGILAPDLQRQYSISDVQYGYIQSAFALAYAFGQFFSGRWLDRVGTRIGYAVALAGWSAASMLHALARGPWGFGIMRGMLGVSESPAFPAATKTLAEWFPKKDRAFAFGFVNAGTNMGAILAPAVVPWLAVNYGWEWAFIGTGSLGLIWLAFWLPLYRAPAEHPRCNAAELAYIHSDPPEPTVKIPWLTLLTYPQAWAFGVGKFLTDSMWWFYMTWFTKFLHTRYGLDLMHIGLPLVMVYLMSDVGSLGGGWLSSFMIRNGVSVNRARKTALFLCALGVIPIMFAQGISQLWGAVLVLGLATASHQGFSSNLYTLVSDMFPKRAVGSVAGFGGTCGYIGASIFQVFVGYRVNDKGNYLVPFIFAGTAYLVAFLAIHLLAPRLRPAIEDGPPPRAFEPIVPGGQP